MSGFLTKHTGHPAMRNWLVKDYPIILRLTDK
jgi:hypothetical protein